MYTVAKSHMRMTQSDRTSLRIRADCGQSARYRPSDGSLSSQITDSFERCLRRQQSYCSYNNYELRQRFIGDRDAAYCQKSTNRRKLA